MTGRREVNASYNFQLERISTELYRKRSSLKNFNSNSKSGYNSYKTVNCSLANVYPTMLGNLNLKKATAFQYKIPITLFQYVQLKLPFPSPLCNKIVQLQISEGLVEDVRECCADQVVYEWLYDGKSHLPHIVYEEIADFLCKEMCYFIM